MNANDTLVRPTPPDFENDRPARDGRRAGDGRDVLEGGRDSREQALDEGAGAATSDEETPPADTTGRAAARLRDADGMAVASFVMGLAGLLVFNVVLGPCALVLGSLALLRGTARRGRALLGISLGVADLAVLAAVTAADQSFSWSLGG
jgi:hypothetical protein